MIRASHVVTAVVGCALLPVPAQAHPQTLIPGVGNEVSVLRNKISRLLIRRQELLYRHKENHPEVRKIERQIKGLRGALAQRRQPRGWNPNPERPSTGRPVPLFRLLQTKSA